MALGAAIAQQTYNVSMHELAKQVFTEEKILNAIRADRIDEGYVCHLVKEYIELIGYPESTQVNGDRCQMMLPIGCLYLVFEGDSIASASFREAHLTMLGNAMTKGDTEFKQWLAVVAKEAIAIKTAKDELRLLREKIRDCDAYTFIEALENADWQVIDEIISQSN